MQESNKCGLFRPGLARRHPTRAQVSSLFGLLIDGGKMSSGKSSFFSWGKKKNKNKEDKTVGE